MENINIESSEYGPKVILNTSGKIEISGKSMMEDAETFYGPIHTWVDAYIASNEGSFTIEFNLKYFNSSSAKQLLKMLMTIDEAEKLKAEVNWLHPAENDILLERGEELKIMVDLPFNFKPF